MLSEEEQLEALMQKAGTGAALQITKLLTISEKVDTSAAVQEFPLALHVTSSLGLGSLARCRCARRWRGTETGGWHAGAGLRTQSARQLDASWNRFVSAIACLCSFFIGLSAAG